MTIISERQLDTLLHRVVDIGMDFKQRHEIYEKRASPTAIRDLLLRDLPEAPRPADEVLQVVVDELLPLCKNEASPNFLGFGDTGDDLNALAGSILATFTQQNLINQSFDSPSATFIEIAVLRWLRDLLGFENQPTSEVRSVWDVGGIITHGGTASNTVAMMLAREQMDSSTMRDGVVDAARFGVIVPRGIGHYSVKSALAWIGVGAQAIEVETRGFRYDQAALADALRRHAGRVMAVVAYAGDSRTQTVEHLREVHDVVRGIDPTIWLHVDACWGVICAFSDKLRHLIDGVALFDSVTVDPHKVMAVPYSLSALLVRDPSSLRSVSSYSDLIMQEDFAFGQVTPFTGTKGWLSLKLWMMMLGHGRAGLAAMAEDRIQRARRFVQMIDDHPRFTRLHDPDMAAVAFVYLPADVDLDRHGLSEREVERVNAVNRAIHDRMLADGRWHLHQFTLPDDHGRLRRHATLSPLRFMANNARTTDRHLGELISYVENVGNELGAAAR